MKMNLSMVYNSRGENDKAEVLLKDVLKNHPEVPEASYSLGLLLAEMQKYDEAVICLEEAAIKMPDRPRVYYNLGLIYQFLGNNAQAELNLNKCLDLEPDSFDFLLALADHHLKAGNFEKVRPLAEKLKMLYPDNNAGVELLKMIPGGN